MREEMLSVRSIKDREMVICLHSEDVDKLFGDRSKPWLELRDDNELNVRIAFGSNAFLPRWCAENDAAWRQFCTYAVLRDRKRVFAYRRGAAGSEERLHGKLSLGVGGHVGYGDCERNSGISVGMLTDAATREIDEELFTGPFREFGLVGVIADDSTPVSRVHIGAVYHVSVDSRLVRPREGCLADPQWMTASELRERRSEFEVWSQIVIDRLLSSDGGQS